jgi:hypothetical protein
MQQMQRDAVEEKKGFTTEFAEGTEEGKREMPAGMPRCGWFSY